MKFLITFIIVLFSVAMASAQMNGVDGKPSVAYQTNLIKNPSAAVNALHATKSLLASKSRDTGSGDLIDGKASWLLQSTLISNYVEFDLLTPSTEQESGNCGFSGIFKGDAAAWSAQILDGSNNVLAKAVFTNESGWREFKLWYPCGASGARKVRIVNSEAGTINPVNVGKLYYGRMEPGAGVPPNTFTALVSNTGVVNRETGGDWINGNCTQSAGQFDCNFTSGLFTSPPNCTGALEVSASGDQTLNRISAGTTSVNILTRTGAGTTTSVGFQISCTKTGSDYIQPAITPNQWNFGTRNSTPTWTNLGFTPGTNVISYSRSGDRLIAKGILEYASGTGSASALTLTLPEGLSIDTVKLGNTSALQHFGSWFWYDDAGSTSTLDDTFGAVTYFSANSVRFYVPNDLSLFRTNLMSANDRFSFNFSVPIVGWTENQGAPQLVGSVTSNAQSALRVEAAEVSAAGVVSNESSDFISGSCTVVSNQTTCPFNAGTFSATPICTAISATLSNYLGRESVSTSSVLIRGYDNTGIGAASAFSIMCIGPR